MICFPAFLFLHWRLFSGEGGASKRLVRVFQALVGQFRGGLRLLLPWSAPFYLVTGLRSHDSGPWRSSLPSSFGGKISNERPWVYDGAGSLGMLFPPCLPLILYAIVANHSATRRHHKANVPRRIGPGVLLVILTAWWNPARAQSSDGPHAFL